MNEERNRLGPLILDANAAENWRKFIREFEIYLVANEKDRKSEKLKVNLLLNFAGSQAIEEYSHFVYGEDVTRMYATSLKNWLEVPRT